MKSDFAVMKLVRTQYKHLLIITNALCILVETPLAIGVCYGSWSSWNDRDDPSGTGDWEILRDRYDAGSICEPQFVIGVEARILGSEEMVTTSQNVELTLTYFVCKNENQPAGEYCFDYEVRFCCDGTLSLGRTNDILVVPPPASPKDMMIEYAITQMPSDEHVQISEITP